MRDGADIGEAVRLQKSNARKVKIMAALPLRFGQSVHSEGYWSILRRAMHGRGTVYLGLINQEAGQRLINLEGEAAASSRVTMVTEPGKPHGFILLADLKI